MMRLRSDLIELCLDALAGRLGQTPIEFDPRAAVGVVMAAGGYPEDYSKGDVIHGLVDAANTAEAKVFHAGTTVKDNQVVTNGGRVLCCTALGDSVTDAQAHAYALVKGITWDHTYYRTDIAHRAISREQQK